MNDVMDKTVKQARKIVVAVIGATVLLAGFAMIVLPGPAFIVIPAGLAILATEFVWARRLLRKAKKKVRQIRNGMGSKSNGGKKCGEQSGSSPEQR
ncbi:MAG: hypothetical protein A2010_04685 [Nitrospirae bacterium GWD2_57_9]|nr:MAG: hypothetical protein A2010_04685 [Nitrospirae bacterium GWD2_57_9]OGW47699.1 MAG: hypothetical protein A2078_05815 [Nitrospirae bacterium GWC2_57_9]